MSPSPPGMRLTRIVGIALAAVTIQAAIAYPLDDVEDSGIRRLQGYANAQHRPQGPKLPPGALLNAADIGLNLLDNKDARFDARAPDPDLQRGLDQLLRNRNPSYSIAIIDITNPQDIRWAGVRPDVKQNPGSVGKILCMLALFDSLARAFPDSGDRARILRETVVSAGDWLSGEIHDVPRFDPVSGRNSFGVIKPNEEFRLAEWVDHMISPSANGAGSVVWREAMLIRHFGDRYPVSRAESEAFFAHTPKAVLTALAQTVIAEPLAAAGLSTESLRQGGFWTSVSKKKVPGGGSYASPRELARFLFRLEQGRLIDEWSSLQMKKYLYITKRRYRYVYAPELSNAAAYFKSGSLYQCQPEEGFVCRKYHGNVRNMMNSIAIIESPAGSENQRRYIVALMSNVLKQNSAWDHSRIAAAIDKLIATGQAQLQERGSEKDMAESGRS